MKQSWLSLFKIKRWHAHQLEGTIKRVWPEVKLDAKIFLKKAFDIKGAITILNWYILLSRLKRFLTLLRSVSRAKCRILLLGSFDWKVEKEKNLFEIYTNWTKWTPGTLSNRRLVGYKIKDSIDQNLNKKPPRKLYLPHLSLCLEKYRFEYAISEINKMGLPLLLHKLVLPYKFYKTDYELPNLQVRQKSNRIYMYLYKTYYQRGRIEASLHFIKNKGLALFKDLFFPSNYRDFLTY